MSVKGQLRGLKHDNIKFIEGDDKIRQEKCLDKIKEVLNQYDCFMIPELNISGDKMQSRVRIMAKPRNIISPGANI